jgi:hypothetical protein
MKLLCAKLAVFAVALVALAVFLSSGAADQPLGKVKSKSISLTFRQDGFAVLRLTGTSEELGNCTGYGELVFVPGEDEDTLDGMGVVAFTAANGDILVGVIAAQLDIIAQTLGFDIHWRDAVTFSDGTTVESSGRFLNRRPPGAVRQPGTMKIEIDHEA